MELYQELLINVLKQQNIAVTFPDLAINAAEIVDLQSYAALNKIKAILLDDSLNDKDCFLKIEEIISGLEEIGCYTGTRHDFG